MKPAIFRPEPIAPEDFEDLGVDVSLQAEGIERETQADAMRQTITRLLIEHGMLLSAIELLNKEIAKFNPDAYEKDLAKSFELGYAQCNKDMFARTEWKELRETVIDWCLSMPTGPMGICSDVVAQGKAKAMERKIKDFERTLR